MHGREMRPFMLAVHLPALEPRVLDLRSALTAPRRLPTAGPRSRYLALLRSAPMQSSRHILPAALLLVLALSGCATAAPPSPTATASTSASVASPAPSDAQTPTESTTTSTTSACTPTSTTRPGGAETAIDGDLDGDGRDDSIFFSRTRHEFGIATASGAVLSVTDPFTGPAPHTGWAAQVSGGAVVMVLADGRDAHLYSLHQSGGNCSIQPVMNDQGQPYVFDLRGTSGTGVGCRPADGALQLGGYDARPVGSDTSHFRVTFTRVTVSADGRTARNGATTVIDAAAPTTSATLRIARDSTCASVPIVGSINR